MMERIAMNLGPKTLYDLNLAMVIITVLVVSVTWTDYVDPTPAKLIRDFLLGAYVVLGFITNGIKPPPPVK